MEAALAITLHSAVHATTGRYTRYFNPFIGTGAIENSLSGNCYPRSSVPFGMVHLSPDTKDSLDYGKASGYDYDDTHTCGFIEQYVHGNETASYNFSRPLQHLLDLT